MSHPVRVACVGLLICAAAVGTVHAQIGTSPRAPTYFETTNDDGGNMQSMCASAAVTAPDGVLTVVTVPGPVGSIDTWFEIRNYATERIHYVIVNGFGGLAGKGLRFDTASVRAHPPEGSLRLEHPAPTEGGRGPAMLLFTGFDGGECAGFTAAIGTWGDEEYRAVVGDLVGARVDVVFEGGLRGSGEFQLCNSNGHVRDRFHTLVHCTPGTVVAIVG